MSDWKHDRSARRKYFTEFGVNGWNEYSALVHPADVANEQVVELDSQYPFHIYAICQHPRILIDPATVSVDQDFVRGDFIVLDGVNRSTVPFKLPNRTPGRGGQVFASMTVASDGATWALLGLMGERLHWGRAAALFRSLSPAHEANDLEVLYVGKSFGKDGDRTAPGRLIAHKTLQRILADMVGRTDREPALLLLNYEYQVISSHDGRVGVYGTTQEENDAHSRDVLEALIDGAAGAEMTSYTEAALIKHFRPPYNTQMFVTFPDGAHASYNKMYELDMLHLSVVLETSQAPLSCRTWSQSVPPTGIHHVGFGLHDTALRAGMMEFPSGEGDQGRPA